MITVDEASKLIWSYDLKHQFKEIKIEDAYGHILAEDIVADRDLPPYDRVAMDGVAVNYPECTRHLKLKMKGIQYAGEQQMSVGSDQDCIEVMTGASLPIGTNTVIPIELIKLMDHTVTLDYSHAKINGNVHKRGVDYKSGELLVNKNQKINSAHINVAATVGKQTLKIKQIGKFAIIATGDELVSIEKEPLDYQIRMSNVYAIKSILNKFEIEAQIFHLSDDKMVLQKELRKIFEEYHHIILIGGVSKGKKDFIPEVLKNLNIKEVFHRISQRPGKPFWFGTSHHNIIYALPGNPVSSIVCTCRYIVPHIKKQLYELSNIEEIKSFSSESVRMKDEINFSKNLNLFKQVSIAVEDGILSARAIHSNGSGDFVNLVHATGFIEIAKEMNKAEKNSILPYWPMY